MFEDLVSNLLSSYLGDYLEGLSTNDLKLSLWKGDVELKNLKVKTEALDFLNLPIQVKSGFAGSIILKIPWKHLGTEPTLIVIDNVFVIACPKSELKYDEEKEKEKAEQRKREQLTQIDENEIRMEEERNAKNDTSMMARLSARIINNLQVRVNHIHIRFEDHSSCPGHPFAAGVILEELRLYSPSEGDAPLIPGVMHKKAHITRFGVYWDFDEPTCIRAEDVESFQQDMDAAFTSASVATATTPTNATSAATTTIPTNATSAPTTTTPTNATSAPTTTTSPHKSNEKQGVCPQHWIVEPISLSFSMDADTRSVELRKPEVKAVVEQVAAEQGWSDQVEETRRMMHAYKHVRKDGVRGRTAAEEWELMSAYLFAKYPGVFLEPSIAVAKDFCYRCWDRSNRAAPVLVVTGEMDRFCVALEQKQYRDLLRFVAALNTQTLRAKYKRFRPREEAVEAAPRAWWRFAIQSVCWENGRQRENKGNGWSTSSCTSARSKGC
ncbi:hypothetical protein BLSTO_05006 [Blastocystis sp. subtype 1]